MNTPERLPRLSGTSKTWPEARSENMGVRDLFGTTVPSRRAERGVQTCVKPDCLLSALQHRRVTRLQQQVERLQQRAVDLEEEKSLARKQFQDRLQLVHESWQDCFERHQQTWARSKADAEEAWAVERDYLKAKIAQLSCAFSDGISTELKEDAAVQASVASIGKSRSSQTPRASNLHSLTGVSNLLRTQSLPDEPALDWADGGTDLVLDFGHAAASYAIQAAEGGITAESYSQAAHTFAQAAALYAHGLVDSSPDTHDQAVNTDKATVGGHLPPSSFLMDGTTPEEALATPGHWTQFDSCPSESSFGSEDSASDNCFLPMEEEEEREEKPVPDQAWWEEFGEFESAPQVHRPAGSYTWPRLVIGNDIVRLPVAQSSAPAASTTQPDKPICGRTQVPRLDLSKAHRAEVPWSAGRKGPGENLADDEDIWQSLSQAGPAAVATKPVCNAFELAIEEPFGRHNTSWANHTRFPTPSSNPWGLPLLPPAPRQALDSSSPGRPIFNFEEFDAKYNPQKASGGTSRGPPNPWGLQDMATPILEIGAAVMDMTPPTVAPAVTYTPVEQLLAEVAMPCPAAPEQAHSFPVSFHDDKLELASMEVMDMSVGDLVSVGGPDACPWDGTAQPSMPDLLSTNLNFESSEGSIHSAAQHAQADTAEQAVQTEPAAAEQSVRSTPRTAAPDSNHSARSMHSRGSQAAETASEHLLPLNCRVAARVSTKLPPLDHEPKLPPLPENFVLPPEMHPVLGKYTWHETQTHATQTSPTASDKAVKEQPSSAARMDLLTGEVTPVANQGSLGGKWLRHKSAPPTPATGGVLDEMARQAGQSVQQLLAPTQLSSIVKDMLGCTLDNSSYLPFSNRLCDSGFMTCQLAQILTPIRAASPNMPSALCANSNSAAEASAAATESAAAREAEQAAIEAVADALLTQLGLDATHLASTASELAAEADSALGSNSAAAPIDVEFDFEYISAAEPGHNEEHAGKKRNAGKDWTTAVAAKVAKGAKLYGGAASTSAAGGSSPGPDKVDLAMMTDTADGGMHSANSATSLSDVLIEVDSASSGASQAAVCFAAAESPSPSEIESVSDDESAFSAIEGGNSPVASLVSSIASFDDAEANSVEEQGTTEEWEML